MRIERIRMRASSKIHTHTHETKQNAKYFKASESNGFQKYSPANTLSHMPELSPEQAFLQLSYKHLKPRVISIMEILTSLDLSNTDGSGFFS